MNQQHTTITRVIESDISHALLSDLNDIFFSASGTQHFDSDAAKAAFRDRWLGSYLTVNPEETFIASSTNGRVVGYLVGALDDPARDPRHAALGYFAAFAPWTARYPAHLHVNVAMQYRSAGTGARLIEAFAAHARSKGAPGMHVVTGKGLRNVSFYLRNGFEGVAEAPWNNGTVVMLGRKLA